MTGLDDIFRLLEERGGARYGGEGVTQLHHALQCAALAERSGAADALVVAALLHDIGHLTADDEGLAAKGEDARHEAAGALALAALFGPEVAEPVRLHVDAKRYLCAVNPRYYERLSAASVTSLTVQGGVFSTAEADAFGRSPHARAATQLRSWDDAAKDPVATTPDLAHYRAIAERLRATPPPPAPGWRPSRRS
jgi:phosphonate degradation associated HDIG domain protein